MSNMICTADQNMGFFPKNEYQAMINSLAVCSGLFKVDYNGVDVTAFNGKVMPWATAAMKVRVKDLAGSSRGVQIGNRSLTDDYLRFDSNIRAVTVAAAHATLPRIDVVYAVATKRPNELGQLEIVSHHEFVVIGIKTGTPAAVPVAPAIDEYPDGEVLLAKINVRPASTSILSSDIQDCRDFIIPTCEQFMELTAAIGASQADLDSLRADLTALQFSTANNFGLVAEQISNLTTIVGGLQPQIDAIQLSLTGIRMDIALLQADMNDVIQRLAPGGDIYDQIYDNRARIIALEIALAALRADAEGADAALQAQIDALTVDLDALDADLAALQADVLSQAADLAQVFTDLSSEIAALDARVDALEAAPVTAPDVLVRLNAAEDDIAELQADLVACCNDGAPEVNNYPNDLSDVTSGVLSPIPLEGTRAFGLGSGPGETTLFSDLFPGAVLDTSKWDGIYYAATVAGGVVSFNDTIGYMATADGKFTPGRKIYRAKFRPKAPNVFYAGTPGPVIRLLITPNFLGETDNYDRFQLSFAWGGGYGYNYVEMRNGSDFGGIQNHWDSALNATGGYLLDTGISFGTTITSMDLEIEFVNNSFICRAGFNGNAKVQFASGDYNPAILAVTGKYDSVTEANDQLWWATIQPSANFFSMDDVYVVDPAGAGYDTSEAVIFTVPAGSDVAALESFRLDANVATPAGTSVSFDLSFDAGATWPQLGVTPGATILTAPGNADGDIRVRVNLAGPGTDTPVVRTFDLRTSKGATQEAIIEKINEILTAAATSLAAIAALPPL